MIPNGRLVICGYMRAQMITHDGEEYAAFVPACLHGAAESSR
jgi:hypothetical protein